MDFTNIAPADPILDCRLCGGTGTIERREGKYVYLDVCSCAQTIYLAEKFQAAFIPPKYQNWDFSEFTPDFQEKNKAALVTLNTYIKRISRKIESGTGLFVSARSGLFKTGILCRVLREAISHGHSAFFSTARGIMDLAFTGYDNQENQQKINTLMAADIVAVASIDQLSFIKNPEARSYRFFGEVLEELDDSGRPILVSSNIPRDALYKNLPSFVSDRLNNLKDVVLRYGTRLRGRTYG